MIDIIHYDSNTSSGFFPYWHTTNDNIDNIDKNTLEIVGHTILTVIWNEH
jgi:Zn-dependent M28 family amino/carboxypeptidase